MHPDITKTIAAMRVDDKHAAAAAARQARRAAGRPGRPGLGWRPRRCPCTARLLSLADQTPAGSGCWDAGFPAGRSRPEQPAGDVRRGPAGGALWA